MEKPSKHWLCMLQIQSLINKLVRMGGKCYLKTTQGLRILDVNIVNKKKKKPNKFINLAKGI